MPDATRALRLLSLAAHELRTPAGVIGGCLALARAAGEDAARRDRALAQATKNYERLVELLAEMGDLWRLEAGEAVFNRSSLSPDAALRNAVRDAGPRMPEGISAMLDTEGLAGLRVSGDPVRLERALGSVLLAVARHSAGEVYISARRTHNAEGHVHITFGQGTAVPHSPAVDALAPVDEFQPGLGLALPIARRVLEADGGTLQALLPLVPLRLIVELPIVP